MWENCEYILLEKKFWTNMMNEEAGQRGRVGLQVPHRHLAPEGEPEREREVREVGRRSKQQRERQGATHESRETRARREGERGHRALRATFMATFESERRRKIDFLLLRILHKKLLSNLLTKSKLKTDHRSAPPTSPRGRGVGAGYGIPRGRGRAMRYARPPSFVSRPSLSLFATLPCTLESRSTSNPLARGAGRCAVWVSAGTFTFYFIFGLT